MDSRKRILVISSKRPFPVQDGASIRTSQMIRMLSQIFEVDLVYTCNPYKTFADLTELRCFCRQISEFLEPKWKCVLRALLGFFKSRPLQCSIAYRTYFPERRVLENSRRKKRRNINDSI